MRLPTTLRVRPLRTPLARRKEGNQRRENLTLDFGGFRCDRFSFLRSCKSLVPKKLCNAAFGCAVFWCAYPGSVLDVVYRYTKRAKSAANCFAGFSSICLLMVLLRASQAWQT